MIVVLVVVGVLLFIGLVVAANSVHILRERAGCRVSPWSPPRVARPGGVLLAPFINWVVRVRLRMVALQVPPQEVITRGNVPARITAGAYFRD